MKSEQYWKERIKEAVQHFWKTRNAQLENQGKTIGRKDAGSRSAVTGGKQMDGFVSLFTDFLVDAGVRDADVFRNRAIELPGWFRAEKKWDLLVISNKRLIAAIEFKSHVGSFGNNFNNRTEEALGSATDLWMAYREGAFAPSQKPWLGYLMLLESSEMAQRSVKVREPHFRVFPEFQGSSYRKRYEVLITKLVRERMYDSAAFLMSPAEAIVDGEYFEPSPELELSTLMQSLKSRVVTLSE